MKSNSLIRQLSGGLLEHRWIAWTIALLLIATSAFLGLQREHAQVADQSRQVTVQARILAGSVAGALAFDDDATINEYLNALKFDDGILAVGIYGSSGRLEAGFSRRGDALPKLVQPRRARIEGLRLSVVQPVRQGNLQLGNVYLLTSLEPLTARLSRYGAIAVILLMSALIIALLGASNAAAVAANRQLQKEIAAREEAENALRQAQKMEALGQLTGGVAHDFNNLLMAASSGLELLERTKDESRRERLKAGIREALDHGARLTQHLLAFSRRSPIRTETVVVGDRIDRLAELLDHSLRENVTVSFDIADYLWPIEVDVSQLDVAVLNLAVNARDAMPKGGTIRIVVRNRPRALGGEDAVEISVKDDGIGMSPTEVEKAFEPFFTMKEVGHGTGLGLSQVYGFTRTAGGTASIESTPGMGTVVTMLFPRSYPTETAVSAPPRPVLAAPAAGLQILLVEDDPALSELVGQMLRELGGQVTRATSAAAALELLATIDPDLILTDLVMPGEVDGLDLARTMRERNAAVPILLMTGYGDSAGFARDEGFPVLSKPFTFEALTALLSEVAESRRKN